MPRQGVIENPAINSPCEEPPRHFRFDDEGITNNIVRGRRVSCYFVPIARPKKKGKSKQPYFDTEWTQDRIEENKTVIITERGLIEPPTRETIPAMLAPPPGAPGESSCA